MFTLVRNNRARLNLLSRWNNVLKLNLANIKRPDKLININKPFIEMICLKLVRLVVNSKELKKVCEAKWYGKNPIKAITIKKHILISS